jgi:voltage-gated potassium channel
MNERVTEGNRSRREQLHEIIFEADTASGKLFDFFLLAAIVLSVVVVTLESVEAIRERYGLALRVAEWIFTILFTVEYGLRLYAVRKPWGYARSFFGVVDLLAVLPTYLSLLIGGAQGLMVIRALRLLRIFRILKVARYVSEMDALVRALRASRAKIAVFLLTVLTLVLIMGAAMYVIEGHESGFTSIPRGMYWAVVTVTTVGYGDLAPRSWLGQAVAAAAMILGYSLIIIPTGIFSMELVQASRRRLTTQNCPACTREGHDPEAVYCKHCSAKL